MQQLNHITYMILRNTLRYQVIQQAKELKQQLTETSEQVRIVRQSIIILLT